MTNDNFNKEKEMKKLLNKDLYRILGLKKEEKPDAEAVQKAYRALSLKLHPDKNKNLDDTLFKELGVVNEILSDSKKYDFTLIKYVLKDASWHKVNGKMYWKGIPNIVDGKTYYKPNIQKFPASESKNLTPKEYYDLQRSYNFDSKATQDLLNDLARGDLTKLTERLTAGADIDKAVIFALGKKNDKLITTLVENGANASAADSNKNSLLMFAASAKQLELAKLLISRNADVKTLNNEGKTALAFAYNQKDSAAMKLLLQKGADSAIIDKTKNSIVILKITGDEVTPIEFTIKGVNAAAEDTALMFAYKALNFEAIEALVENGADVNMVDPITKNSLLMTAISAKQTDLAKLLIEKKANVSLVNKEGKTALLLAYDQQDLSMMKLLLQNGAKLAVIDKTKNSIVIFKITGDEVMPIEFPITEITALSIDTPLTFALRATNFEAIKALVENGEDINLTNRFNKNTLLISMVYAKQPDMVKFLLDKGAEMSALNNEGVTALSIAYSQQDSSIMKLLLQKGAKSAIIDKAKNSIVILKITSDEVMPIEFPIKGIKATAKDTPLILAYKALNFEAIEALVENGDDVNMVDPDTKSTLLMLAVSAKQEDLVTLLIEKEADVNVLNKDGKSALSFAYDQQNSSMMKILLQNGAKSAVIDHNKNNIAILSIVDDEVKAEAEFLIKGAVDSSTLELFNNDPIKYILDIYTKTTPALEAITNFHHLDAYMELDISLERTEICLESLNKNPDYGLTLNDLCGKDGSNIVYED